MIQLFQIKPRTGKLWTWKVETKGDKVTTTYGCVGGKMQTATETAEAKNVGRANEVSAAEQAVLIAERYAKGKRDNGWCDSIEEAEAATSMGDSLDYDNPPVSFCPAKPIKKISDRRLLDLWASGNAIVQRKFDGRCMIIFVGDQVHILTRGKMEDRTMHFPQCLKGLQQLPQGTILLAEAVAPGTRDDFNYVASILGTDDATEAVAKQSVEGKLMLVNYDMLHWRGEDWTGRPYRDRIGQMDLWRRRFRGKTGSVISHILAPMTLNGQHDFDDLFGDNALATTEGWEGYVVWDANGTTEIRFDGKEARKNSYKFKLEHTEDVWVDNPYTRRDPKRLGAVEMFQYQDGKMVPVGSCGGGFSREQRYNLWQNRDTVFPCAIEVTTPERLPSGKLRFAQFVRLRPDKRAEDCTPQLKAR